VNLGNLKAIENKIQTAFISKKFLPGMGNLSVLKYSFTIWPIKLGYKNLMRGKITFTGY